MEDRWCKQIDDATNKFAQSFRALSVEQINWKPDSTVWSIAQNLDHLIVINRTYFPIIEQLKTGSYQTRFIANWNWLVHLTGKIVLKAVQPDRNKKMKTFPIWEPSKSNFGLDILTDFEKHQSELKAMIQSSSYFLDTETVISSPANKNIVYKLETAFDIIVTHEFRHFEQAKEVFEISKQRGI
jgi:hypothetical protein